MRSPLFEAAHQSAPATARFHLQSSKMLKVTLGEPVLATAGSMVAFRGSVEFDKPAVGGFGKFLKKAVSSDDAALMRASGTGEVYFADTAKDVFLVDLTGDSLSVSGHSLLAFDAALDWDLKRVKGAGVAAGGFLNTVISGTGQVALTSDGPPMLLDCSQAPVAVDANALVAWSGHLVPTVRSSMNLRSMIRGGTGEAFQLVFAGQGFVVVQPSEGQPPCTAAGGSGSGGGVLDALLG